jgi:rhodanese-related sulfurtransferase
MLHSSIIKELSIILFFSLFISVIVNYYHPKGLKLTEPYTLNQVQSEPDAEVSTGPESIDINEAASYYERQDYLFIDARSEADYNQCHIKNAMSLPEHEFDQFIDRFMTQTNPQQKLITYCGSADCQLSVHLAEKLYFMGFDQVYHLTGGLDAWLDENLPVQQQ